MFNANDFEDLHTVAIITADALFGSILARKAVIQGCQGLSILRLR